MNKVQTLSVAACLLAIAGCATNRGASEAIESPNACALAGDNCVKNIGDVRACRAAQATCEAQSAQMAAMSGQAPDPMAPTRRVRAPVMPARAPLSPDGEAIIEHPDPATASDCAAQVKQLVEDKLHGRIVRVLVTSHPRWGIVWRADIETPTGKAPYPQRVVCAQAAIEIAPMEMLNSAENLKPLPEAGANRN
jgi:hypothetical protein